MLRELAPWCLAPLTLALALSCSSGGDNATSTTSSSVGAGTGAGGCPSCTTSHDCAAGSVCTQLGDDSYCAPACPNGNECAADRSCASANAVDGTQVSVCVLPDVACSPVAGTGGGPPTQMCGPLVGPDVAATCTGCKPPKQCQANGCYSGWWCNTGSKKCQAPPANCMSTGIPIDAGPAVTGTVDATGGKLSRLLFAAVGDTRPAMIDDTAGYPTDIITKIYGDLEAFKPHPPFLLSTGDYVFAQSDGNQANPQLDSYLAARAAFTGTAFAAMGNHECTGATASNCGPGAPDGTTANYNAFLAKMLGPIGQSNPYYSVEVDATDGSWTSKFVFVAGNAWSSAQAAWLDATLSTSTTYTFVIRHESASVTQAPGVTPSEQIMTQHPYTLAIVGHTHTYQRSGPREIIVGNGGAPLTGSKNYGFAILNQRADKAIQIDMVDYESGLGDETFHFAVNPDGSPAP